MTLICETQAEGEATLLINKAGRQLVNAILFETEDAPEAIKRLAKVLGGAFLMFDEAQADIRLAHMAPEGEA